MKQFGWLWFFGQSVPPGATLILASPKCILALLRSLLTQGLIDLDLQVHFLISNLLFFTKLCVSNSFALCCIYFVRPFSVKVPHPTWLHTHTDPYAWDWVPPWTMKQSTFISWWDHWSSASLDLAIDTGFHKLLSVFAISYTLHMLKFDVPTLISHQNNSKQHSLAFILFDFQCCISTSFSAIGKHLRQYRISVCSTS